MLCAFRNAALVLAVLVSTPITGFAQQKITNDEQTLFDSTNRERMAEGLPPLKWDTALARSAHQHALRMARQNSLSHQYPGEPDLAARATQTGARFGTIAENVAEGPSAENIYAQLMKSPPHRANLLATDMDSIGIAVIGRDGQLFAVEDFSMAVANLSVEQQEKQVGALLEARGLHLLTNNGDARRTCALDRGARVRRPLSFVLYETADLSQVPDDLEQRILSGRYHSTVVGACQSGGRSGFSKYRLAVLLY